jgi:SNF2 family DNA or RNA helicase
VARFWGGNRNTREQEEGDFKQNPSTRFMVATAAAGGRGRTWTQADLVIYFSNTWNLEHREQSEERAQGVGKTKNVLYIDLVAVRQNGSETIDMRILKTLEIK